MADLVNIYGTCIVCSIKTDDEHCMGGHKFNMI